MATLETSFSGMGEKEIREMSHDKLVEAVVRLIKVKEIRCQHYRGAGYLPEHLADAFLNGEKE
jgi:hypothetical protein